MTRPVPTIAMLGVLITAISPPAQGQQPLGTEITYQGLLNQDGSPLNDEADFEFSLWDAESDGNQIASTIFAGGVALFDGLFTVELDFGAAAYNGDKRWLEVAVRSPAGGGAFTTLSPRQPITRAPYAIQTRGIFVDDLGRVGIGTTAPFANLHVDENSDFGAVVRIDSGSTAPQPSVIVLEDRGIPRWYVRKNQDNDFVIQDSLVVNRLKIDQPTGRVNIGPFNRSGAQLVVEAEGGRAIRAVTGSGINAAVVGEHNGNEAGGIGVAGGTQSTSGHGVRGVATNFFGNSQGVHGSTLAEFGFGVFSNGNFGGTGAKYFIQPHPTDPSKEIRFVSLEGNESGTYFRGSSRLEDGRAVIDVPEDFRLASEPAGLTVQVTAMGPNAGLWIESKNLDRIVVRGNANVAFDYFVNGVRRGFAGLETICENQGYVPETRGVPFGTQYREAHRRILVENGTLNADFTPSEQTAAHMGWTLNDAESEAGSRP